MFRRIRPLASLTARRSSLRSIETRFNSTSRDSLSSATLGKVPQRTTTGLISVPSTSLCEKIERAGANPCPRRCKSLPHDLLEGFHRFVVIWLVGHFGHNLLVSDNAVLVNNPNGARQKFQFLDEHAVFEPEVSVLVVA